MNCGLLGRKLGHSYSPQIHKQLGCYTYDLFEREPEDLREFLTQRSFTGLNVTIPYKKAVIPYCSQLSQVAERLGAVNTIVRKPDGSLIGHNTDYFGFSSMVQKTGLQVAGKKVLILGSGGASATAAAVLQELNAQVVVISRSGEDNYTNLSRHADCRIIVNATPVGMFPNVGISPIDLAQFPQLEGVLDLIYNPARTRLLMDAEAHGLVTENGLWMLVAQAKESAQWFTGQRIDDKVIGQIYQMLCRQMENIVLIGMPGCGKSTVGKLLAEKLNRPFIDADARIAEQAGMPIPEIFARESETGFRQRETKILSELGMGAGAVIATGGGCVTQSDNYPLLHQNSRIYWLKRAVVTLPTEGRPLSQTQDLGQMYARREPMYQHFADAAVDNNRTPEETVKQILSMEGYL